MVSTPNISGTTNQAGVEGNKEGSPTEESVLPFKATSEKGDKEMGLAYPS